MQGYIPKVWFFFYLPMAGFLMGGTFALGWHFASAAQTVTPTPLKTACERYVPTTAMFSHVADQLGNRCANQVNAAALHPTLVRSSALASTSFRLFKTTQNQESIHYNMVAPPPFWSADRGAQSPSLKGIIDNVLTQLTQDGYPTDSVSISLVDLTGQCCEYYGFQDRQKRYPASVVKLFWLVALYGQYDAGLLRPNVDVAEFDEALMAHYSNNGASSRILDAITQTESGEALSDSEFAEWRKARLRVNDYFEWANYTDFNIAHKTFPIPDLELLERAGRDLQLSETETGIDRKQPGESPERVNRNYLTTAAMARLLYEIDAGLAISQEYSDRIKAHLKHSTDPAVWQYEEDNAIEGFFGEYLPVDAQLYTKLGFTFEDGRQEAAIMASPDNETRFILVVFANDPIFSDLSSTVFPDIARSVYDQMQRR